jgi:copper chaperone CopZ
MKFLLIAAMLAAPAMPVAAAIEVRDSSQFIVEVKGIVCSFCAYGARKNLSRVDYLDRSRFKEGLLMETEKGSITGAIAKGMKIDFPKTFRAIQKGGYEILAIHLNLAGIPQRRDDSAVLSNNYNGQEFLLMDEGGQPWDAKDKWGKEVSLQAYASEAVLAKAAPDRPLTVTVKGGNTKGARLSLGVEGMVCENCSTRLEKVLRGTPGVKSASVNLKDKSAVVEIDPTVVSEKEIIEAVKETGFSATIKK